MLDDINLERIQQRTIRKYVECEIKDGKHQFSEIHPSWNTGKDLSSYRKREKIFFLNSNLQDVWQGYVSANPSNIWSSRKISFGLLLRKFPSHIFYNHDPIMGADTGQVYYLNLKLMLGICNLAVAFEIITLDTKKLILEFSYIEGNKSTGVQQVRFIDVGGGRTEIIHTSYFKSGSHFRDKWLYPYFHNRFINEFHRNMRRLLKLNKQNENKEAATNI
jgi:hypothetical protein